MALLGDSALRGDNLPLPAAVREGERTFLEGDRAVLRLLCDPTSFFLGTFLELRPKENLMPEKRRLDFLALSLPTRLRTISTLAAASASPLASWRAAAGAAAAAPR